MEKELLITILEGYNKYVSDLGKAFELKDENHFNYVKNELEINIDRLILKLKMKR